MRPSIVTGTGVLIGLAIAALIPPLRLPVVAALIVGLLVAPRDSSARWAFAAGLPVALILLWGSFIGGPVREGADGCADPLSPLAWERVIEALIVIGVIGLLARYLRTPVRDLGLRRPGRAELVLGVAAIALIPIPSLYLGAVLAEPFFGPIDLDLSQPLAIVPAVTLAVANGTMEELAYRGALMAWMSRATTPMVGLLGQALVFGAAHSGSDYTGSALPVVLAIAAAGLLAGLIVRRTGSLWLPIVVHIAFDVPLYYAVACRLS